jgi:biotin--protein ligase
MPEVLGPELGKRVRIKWPNDLYLDLSENGNTSNPKENLKKIGGILVNTNFAPGGKVDIVVGECFFEPSLSSSVSDLSFV